VRATYSKLVNSKRVNSRPAVLKALNMIRNALQSTSLVFGYIDTKISNNVLSATSYSILKIEAAGISETLLT
jgi:hypothetical protein